MDKKRFCHRVKLTKGRKAYYIHYKEKDSYAVPLLDVLTELDGVLGSLQAPAGGGSLTNVQYVT
jgi:hypothetical protein